MNYYNENDPKAAAWLRELIAAGELPPGIVDERSITDVRKSDLEGYTQFHTFCGIGGWPLALKLAGWPEDQPVWTGSCPCQPFSQSGAGRVDKDERHLWPAFRTAIAECRPPILFGEQVASKDGRIWLAGVRADLEALGFSFGAADLCAASVGAPHIRQRLYWMAYLPNSGLEGATRTLLQRHSGRPSCDCEYGRVAHTASGGLGINGSTSRECGHIDFRGETVGMADTECGTTERQRLDVAAAQGGAQEEARERQRIRDDVRAGSVPERMGDTDDSAKERQQCVGVSMESKQEAGGRGFADAWSNFEVVGCADGKARRFERGSFPLVNELPEGVVPSGDLGLSEVQNTKEARVMRLRGYGNAIVPQLAAEFIMACMDVLRFDLK